VERYSEGKKKPHQVKGIGIAWDILSTNGEIHSRAKKNKRRKHSG